MEDGIILTKEAAPSGAIIVVGTSPSIPSLRAYWANSAGIEQSRMVKGIYDAGEANFSVKRGDAFGFVFLPSR